MSTKYDTCMYQPWYLGTKLVTVGTKSDTYIYQTWYLGTRSNTYRYQSIMILLKYHSTLRTKNHILPRQSSIKPTKKIDSRKKVIIAVETPIEHVEHPKIKPQTQANARAQGSRAKI